MNSFFKSALLVAALISLSFVLIKIIESLFPLLENKWYFGLGIFIGVLGYLFIQHQYKRYDKIEQRDSSF